jgi:hypothetical protein
MSELVAYRNIRNGVVFEMFTKDSECKPIMKVHDGESALSHDDLLAVLNTKESLELLRERIK